ncbi:MAG: group III truncated hemoglobin [Planktotalea sp.]|uniref:group III truncated hemoglobin n=1 Tax=Planktotalea sp. TaxID=2029877 RepID=UPI003C75D240
MLARFPITAAQIDQVTRAFYARVRVHPALGPVFAAHVSDWTPHEAKIAAFWRNAILLERSYAGNPMQVHKAAGNVHAEHFSIWLALFDEVLAQNLDSETARSWSALAHRIGRGLSMGLTPVVLAGDAPPRFI